MHKRLTIAAYAFLAAIVPFPSSQAASSSPQDAAPKENSKSDARPRNRPTPLPPPRNRPHAAKRPGRNPSKPAQPGRQPAVKPRSRCNRASSANQSTDTKTTSPCRTRPRPPRKSSWSIFDRAAFSATRSKKATPRPLTVDGEIRKRGAKTILRQKKKLIEFNPVYPTPPRFVYVKQSVSLKGLAPGDYDLIIILHDELAKGATATQTVKFKVIPPLDPHKVQEAKEPPPPHILDSLYAPFLDNGLSDDDE